MPRRRSPRTSAQTNLRAANAQTRTDPSPEARIAPEPEAALPVPQTAPDAESTATADEAAADIREDRASSAGSAQPARSPLAPRLEPAVTQQTREPAPLLAGSSATAVSTSQITAPVLIENTVPAHPYGAPATDTRVIVDVRVLVGTDGLPVIVRPAGEPVGWGYDGAAIGSAQTTVWAPARDANGELMEMWVTVRYRFAARTTEAAPATVIRSEELDENRSAGLVSTP